MRSKIVRMESIEWKYRRSGCEQNKKQNKKHLWWRYCIMLYTLFISIVSDQSIYLFVKQSILHTTLAYILLFFRSQIPSPSLCNYLPLILNLISIMHLCQLTYTHPTLMLQINITQLEEVTAYPSTFRYLLRIPNNMQ